MTSKSDLVRELAAGTNLTQAQARDAITGLVTILTGHMRAENDVRIDGLGTFKVKKMAERFGRNPATGESIRIAASRKVAFKPATTLKAAI